MTRLNDLDHAARPILALSSRRGRHARPATASRPQPKLRVVYDAPLRPPRHGHPAALIAPPVAGTCNWPQAAVEN